MFRLYCNFIRVTSSFNFFISRNYQVTVVGGATEIGQSVCLLLRTLPNITKLVIHDDLEHTAGVVLDLSHIPTKSTLQCFTGETTLDEALKSSDLIIATGATILSPGTSEESCFHTNASFIKTLASRIAKVFPTPFVGIATEPINILVPMAAEVMRNNGEYNPRKLFGITTGDPLKVRAMYAAENDVNPQDLSIPVIGGHSDSTIVPLLSQIQPNCSMDDNYMQEFTAKVRSLQEDVTSAKKGYSPTLSVAYGVAAFTAGILNAFNNQPCKINAFVENNDFGTWFFSGLLCVDKAGAGDMQRYTTLTEFECQVLERSVDQLRKDVMMGKTFLELA